MQTPPSWADLRRHSKKYDLGSLESDTIYYADEKHDGLSTHPLADIFFRTTDGILVLIDVTGGTEDLVGQKTLKLETWINTVLEEAKNRFEFPRFAGWFLPLLLKGNLPAISSVSFVEKMLVFFWEGLYRSFTGWSHRLRNNNTTTDMF